MLNTSKIISLRNETSVLMTVTEPIKNSINQCIYGLQQTVFVNICLNLLFIETFTSVKEIIEYLKIKNL